MWKLSSSTFFRFRSRVCSYSLVKEMAIKNELTLYPFFLLKYALPRERRVGQKIWSMECNTKKQKNWNYFLPLSIFIENSSWTNAQIFSFINFITINKCFIPRLSYYWTKKKLYYIIKDEINSEALFLILADGIPLV